jgi:hypothetical protein
MSNKYNKDKKELITNLEKLGLSKEKISEKIKIYNKLNKSKIKRFKNYQDKVKNKKNKKFAILQENIKRKVKGNNKYVPLIDYVINIKRLNLLGKDSERKRKNLEIANKLKNTIFFPSIATINAEVLCETDLSDLKNWVYWAIELNPKQMSSGYLSTWFNLNLPKQQILGASTASTIPNLTKADIEKLRVINHSLKQQKQILINLQTSNELMIKALKLREANVFEPTNLSIDDITKNIPDLEIQRLLKTEESVKHELKSTMRYSIKTKKIEDFLVDPILKTIVAFLNTEGGHLIVGVQETINGDNIVIGIEVDGFKSQDEWHRHLKSKIKSRIDIKFLENNIKVEFKKVEDKTIAIIKVAALDKKEHAMLDEKKIYERKGPSNEELPIKNIGKWIIDRIEKINAAF